MGNTNFQTIFQMQSIVNSVVKQATGREAVQNIDMDYVTVAQQRKTGENTIDFTETASFVNNNELPLKVLAKITAVQSGTGDPAPDNVRPITGWTGVNVTRTGKNLINVNSETWIHYNVSSTYWGANAEAIVAMFNALKPGTYTFTFLEYVDVVNNTRSGVYGMLIRRNVNGVTIDIDARTTTAVTAPKELFKSVTFTLTDADVGTFTHAYLYSGFPREATQNSAKFYDFQIEPGSTATAYEPYSGTTIPVSWETEAGTVYGGVLNVTTGVLTVDRGLVTLNGTESWTAYPSYEGYQYRIQNMKSGVRQEGHSNMLVPAYTSASGQKNTMWLGVNTSIFYAIGVYETMGNTLESFKSFLATNNLQVEYPLANPVTYQLTPTEIDSLIGENNLYADTGDISVSYTTYYPTI